MNNNDPFDYPQHNPEQPDMPFTNHVLGQSQPHYDTPQKTDAIDSIDDNVDTAVMDGNIETNPIDDNIEFTDNVDIDHASKISHEIEYTLRGDIMPAVEIELDPGEAVIAEAGMMNYFDKGIDFETKLGDGSNPKQGLFGKLFGAAKRLMSNESLFLTHFTNNTNEIKHAAFSAPYPGQILPLDLAALGGHIYCQKGAFLCAAMGTKISFTITKRIDSGMFGGEGFVLQSIKGDGKAFIHGGGTIVEKQLADETLYVDTGCLVAFTQGIDYDIKAQSSIKTMMFGGEGVFITKLSGTGKVWIQTMPFTKLTGTLSDVITQDVLDRISKQEK